MSYCLVLFLSFFLSFLVRSGYCCYFHSCFCVQVFEFILMWKSGKNKHGNDKVFTFKIWAPFFSIKEKEDKFIGGRVRR